MNMHQTEGNDKAGESEFAQFLVTAQIQAKFDQAIRYHQAGNLAHAEQIYKEILAQEKGHADSWHLLGVIASQVQQHDVAVNLISQAISLKQNDAIYYSNIANPLRLLGRLEEAKQCCLRAIALKPEYAEAYNNLGNVLMDLGNVVQAQEIFQRALTLNPGLSEAHNNLGNALKDSGNLSEAMVSYERALVLNPNYSDASYNLASVFHTLGQADQALRVALRTLQLSGLPKVKQLVVRCLTDINVSTSIVDTDVLRRLVCVALSEGWTRPARLASTVNRLLGLDPNFVALLTRTVAGEDCSYQNLIQRYRILTGNELFHALLKSSPVVGHGMEKFLTILRKDLLRLHSEISINSGDFQTLCSVIAQQCFINEYIFAVTNEEYEEIDRLEIRIGSAVTAGQAPHPMDILTVACYRPLKEISNFEKLLNYAWPQAVVTVIKQQLVEPLAEVVLRASISALTPIVDVTSVEVRQQYEENPYPRWMKSNPPIERVSINVHLHRRFPLAKFYDLEKVDALDILIAGCGTGQHSIETAQNYPSAKVVAIDLSLASLGFAIRKTQEAGVTNVQYAQADILNLGIITNTFDVIESSGVLHHISDPIRAWDVLVGLLRPKGFMRIGLYSKLARTSVNAVRELIAERGFQDTEKGIRACRQEIIAASEESPLRKVSQWSDFYAMSPCRDLLFHVQEHQFTLEQIKDYLVKQNLSFIGFEIDNQIIRRYVSKYPQDPGAVNLDLWHEYETEFPDTFAGMYQFWVQKG